jgi:DNA-binding LacI/PurR family transcriptional regulator
MCLEDIGRKAAQLLLTAINGEPARSLHTVPCRLLIRASSGHPRAERTQQP